MNDSTTTAGVASGQLTIMDAADGAAMDKSPWPRDVFPELNELQLRQLKHAVSVYLGCPFDRVSAYFMRRGWLCAVEEQRKSFSQQIIDAQAEEQNLDDPFFPGAGYEKDIDQKRLTKQMLRVFLFMCDEQWHTLADIYAATGAPEASASACLRALTRPEWGAHGKLVERVAETRGQRRYKLIPNCLSLTYRLAMEQREHSNQTPCS